MRCLIITTFVCLLWQSETRPVSNPLASLMGKNESSEVKQLVTQILSTAMRHVTMTALGFPPTFEEFHKDMLNISITVFLLPYKVHMGLVATAKTIESAQKAEVEKGMGEFANKVELLNRRLNSPATRHLLEEVREKFNFLAESDEAIEYIRNRDPEMAETMSNFIKEAKEQYKLLESENSKKFIDDTLEYIKNKNEKEISEETFTHMQQKFIQLTEEEKFDVAHRMTWFMKPMWKYLHKYVVESGKLPMFGEGAISGKKTVSRTKPIY